MNNISTIKYARHYPGAIECSKKNYKKIKNTIEWDQEVIRNRPVYRWTALYSHEDYNYAGTKHNVHTVWPKLLVKILNMVNELLTDELGEENKFNTIFALYYPDGNSQIGYHSDDETKSVPGSHVASLSLGTGRDFLIKTVKCGTLRFSHQNRKVWDFT